jgi:ribosomal-protein-alanine N-acetyltransferase
MAGMVLGVEDRIVAYLLYEVYDHHLEVIRFAVHPEYRRQGLGRKMLKMLAVKLIAHRRRAIAVDVWDWDTTTQLWLRACGFQAIKVVSGAAGDLYRFVFRAPVEAAATVSGMLG